MASPWSDLRVLDGGLGMYAEELSPLKMDGHPLWSGRLVRDDPRLLKKIHTEFLDAGADIIETVSYQLTVQNVTEFYGHSSSQAAQVLTDSVLLASEAVDEAWPRLQASGRHRPQVAGSAGPLGATLCDRSEYSGEYVDALSEEALMDWHRPRVQALTAAGDRLGLLAFDSLPAVKEARAIVRLLREFPGTRAWISFSSHDGRRTCRGEALAAAAAAVAESEAVMAVGVNCCLPPRLVAGALTELRKGSGEKTLVAFPNTGQRYDAASKTFHADTSEVTIADCVEEWVALGCRWIGGCCGSRPDDIAAVARRMDELRRR